MVEQQRHNTIGAWWRLLCNCLASFGFKDDRGEKLAFEEVYDTQEFGRLGRHLP